MRANKKKTDSPTSENPVPDQSLSETSMDDKQNDASDTSSEEVPKINDISETSIDYNNDQNNENENENDSPLYSISSQLMLTENK